MFTFVYLHERVDFIVFLSIFSIFAYVVFTCYSLLFQNQVIQTDCLTFHSVLLNSYLLKKYFPFLTATVSTDASTEKNMLVLAWLYFSDSLKHSMSNIFNNLFYNVLHVQHSHLHLLSLSGGKQRSVSVCHRIRDHRLFSLT